MRRTLIYLFILMLCAACGDTQTVRDQKAQRERHVKDSLAFKVGVMPTLDGLPIFVAHERGIFDTLGVDVRLKLFRAQMDCDTALAGGSVQGSVTDLVRAERLQQHGTPLVYKIATESYWQLVTNRKQRITKLSDLSDKMIAMARYSVSDMMATQAINTGKLKNPAFKVQVNDVLIRQSMLQNNEMDALILTEPQATMARLYKHPVLLDTRDEDWHMGVVAFRSKDIDTEHRSHQLDLFLKAYNVACDSLRKYGISHYASIIEKYCKADLRTVKALPKTDFPHAHAPRQKDILTAQQWINTLKNKP